MLDDRAATGWSDDVALPRPADAVDALRALLAALGVPSPYLLVGDSLDGLYAQRYAQRSPARSLRCCCSSPPHEDWDRYQPEHLRLATKARPRSHRLSQPRPCSTGSASRSWAGWRPSPPPSAMW